VTTPDLTGTPDLDRVPTLYYQDEHVSLYWGNALLTDVWLSANVLVFDPPYGVKAHFNHKGQIAGDANTDVRDGVLALWGTTRPALVFGRWDTPRPAGTRARRVWDKGQGPGKGNLRFPFGQGDEEIYVLGEWPEVVPGGWRREGGTPRRWGSVITDIPGYNSQSADRPRWHPTPKPPKLFAHLLDTCPPGTVADPCVGSGPLLIAARWVGRRAIGVEIDERHCENTAKRLERTTDLFTGSAS
jgi:site-specific DNA-methyltransferase (adenine-specific)